jgi:hypothetical protein
MACGWRFWSDSALALVPPEAGALRATHSMEDEELRCMKGGIAMAQNANAMHMGSQAANTSARPATFSPDRPIQGDTPGELNVWLFVSVVPVTFVAIIIALAMIVPR